VATPWPTGKLAPGVKITTSTGAGKTTAVLLLSTELDRDGEVVRAGFDVRPAEGIILEISQT